MIMQQLVCLQLISSLNGHDPVLPSLPTPVFFFKCTGHSSPLLLSLCVETQAHDYDTNNLSYVYDWVSLLLTLSQVLEETLTAKITSQTTHANQVISSTYIRFKFDLNL